MSAGEFEEGPPSVALSDEWLARIGLATIYETSAKTALSISLKALSSLSHDEWIELDKRQFGQIVDQMVIALDSIPELKPYFEGIRKNHERWRDGRNFVVHANWGESALGRPMAYCYRRQQLGDENDIVRALNDALWLAREARTFQYQVALLIAKGTLREGETGSAGISMRTPSRTVHF